MQQQRSKWAPGAEALAAAAQAVARVVSQGRSADDALTSTEPSVRAITLGTLRWYLRLAPPIDSLLKNPKTLPAELHALLVAAAHQIEYSRNAPQVVVHSAVDAARVLGAPRATGVVNAVLRRFVAERESLLSRFDATLAVRTAHPEWLVNAICEAWPDQSSQILEANNAHPPMVLRAIERDAYLQRLPSARPIEGFPNAIELDKPVPVSALPGFDEGLVSVQDAGAQLAAVLLDAQPGMRVLDACAAPGGKTGHILQRTPSLSELVALDIDEQRLTRVKETLSRLKQSATLVAADIRHWQGGTFDRILIDAPCSSTGVIRRHPDIKLLRRATDIPALANTQLEILQATFRMLKSGGRLLYATCSVLPEENEESIHRFMEAEPAARVMPLEPPSGAVSKKFGWQLLPGAKAGTDGFYYACVEKATAGN
jgi:16S rRNA (cytosine967-C5)-methyltransferase